MLPLELRSLYNSFVHDKNQIQKRMCFVYSFGGKCFKRDNQLNEILWHFNDLIAIPNSIGGI